MNRITFSLFTIYQLSLSEIIGPHGQNCSPGDDDNPPDACPILQQYTSLTDTIIECNENFDCCTCESITCGLQDGDSYCEKFVASGDSSAFYVSPIYVFGDPDDGVSIECGGDSSCEGTLIQGTGIKDIKCGGDRSCFLSTIDVNCVSDGCELECSGDSSCSGTSIDRGGDITMRNSKGIKCGGDNACALRDFYLWNVIEGKIECDGENACRNTFIETIGELEMVICGNDYSCSDAGFVIYDFAEDLEVQCKGVGSCKGLHLQISCCYLSSEVNNVKIIDCSAKGACEEAVISITNDTEEPLIIKEINCEAEDACKMTQFYIEGNVVVEECKCGDNGCEGATGIPSCFHD